MQRHKKICKKCNIEQYLFSKKLCVSCYRKEYPEKFQLKNKSGYSSNDKKSKPRKTSKRQEERLKKYRLLRDAYFKEHDTCEFVDETGVRCTSKDIDLHHKEGRVGARLFRSFMSLCRKHHIEIHLRPEWAKEKGYLL